MYTEKATNKVQQPIMRKALKKLQIEGADLNIMKAPHCKPTLNIIINEGNNRFPLDKVPTFFILIQYSAERLS